MKKIFILLLLLICPFVVNAKEITEEDVIKSVKKVGGKRSAWASAGIADNTRSF